MRGKELAEFLSSEYHHHFAGWDFSYIDGRRTEVTPPWSYSSLASDLLQHSTSAVDLGTGGGERLIAFKEVFPQYLTATEGYAPNLHLARERLKPLGIDVFESAGSLTQILPFVDEAFDLVLDRHTAFNATEVARVLKHDGVFLTQQVDGRATDLQAAFDAHPQWSYFTLDFALQQVEATSLIVDRAEEWTGEVTFTDVGAVVYYLKAVPWTVTDFSVERYLPQLEKLQQRLERDGKLTFHQTLMVIKAHKP